MITNHLQQKFIFDFDCEDDSLHVYTENNKERIKLYIVTNKSELLYSPDHKSKPSLVIGNFNIHSLPNNKYNFVFTFDKEYLSVIKNTNFKNSKIRLEYKTSIAWFIDNEEKLIPAISYVNEVISNELSIGIDFNHHSLSESLFILDYF